MGDEVKIKIGYFNMTDHLIPGITGDRADKKIEAFEYTKSGTVPVMILFR